MKRVLDWLKVMRLWALTATTTPVLAGAALAALDGRFSWGMLALTLSCGWALHIATNLLNTWGDYKSGIDQRAETLTSPQLVTGVFNPPEIFRAGVAVLAVAVTLVVVIVTRSDWRLIWFAVPGVLGAGCYTTGFRYKYMGLGVPAAFFLTGFVMVGASYFAQTCAPLTWAVAAVAFPISCLVGGILLGNDLRDMASDREAGIQTTALFLGAKAALALFCALHLLPYAGVAAGIAAGVLPRGCLLVLLTAPLTFGVVKTARDGFRAGDHAKVAKLEGMTAGIHLVFGVLETAGLAAGLFMAG